MTTRHELYTYLQSSAMFNDWHWFRWHFERRGVDGREHPFATSVISACIDVERRVPGFAHRWLDRLAQITGRGDPDNRDLLFTLLAELLVGRQLVRHPWVAPLTFDADVQGPGSKKDVDFVISGSDFDFLVEVKAPSLSEYAKSRHASRIQATARLQPPLTSLLSRNVTLPRDNPMKDFLISAEDKFAPFKRSRSGRSVWSVLVVVWDDHVNEPISALLSPSSGLFTPSSFFRDQDGSAIEFPAVDGVLIIRHLHQFVRATQDEPLADELPEALHYGKRHQFPWKVLIPNPAGSSLPSDIWQVLQARELEDGLGGEYIPGEMILWLEDQHSAAMNGLSLRLGTDESPDMPPGRTLFGRR